jgi:hypothetical protein
MKKSMAAFKLRAMLSTALRRGVDWLRRVMRLPQNFHR